MFTVEEAAVVNASQPGGHTKNLFLKDKKGGLWLVVLRDDFRLDLNGLSKQIGAPRFSFGSGELLIATLGVPPGSVTPFALINDRERKVRVVLDEAMLGARAAQLPSAAQRPHDRRQRCRSPEIHRRLRAHPTDRHSAGGLMKPVMAACGCRRVTSAIRYISDSDQRMAGSPRRSGKARGCIPPAACRVILGSDAPETAGLFFRASNAHLSARELERAQMALIGPGGRPVTSANPASASGAGGASSPHIKDSGLATFAADVLDASREVPVIVDFWAPWCGPCKQLGPALEKAVNDAKGAVKLVKINIDENPEIAQQLRIQSIPTVYAFKNGQPVDGFMGAIPESQIRAFVASWLAARRRPWRPRSRRRSAGRRRRSVRRPATSARRPRPMAMCCRTSPAIPRRWRAWRAAI